MNDETVSAKDLKRIYLGQAKEQNSLIKRDSSELLTPSARYIIQAARKRLGVSELESKTPSESELFSLVKLVEAEEGEELTERERTAVVAVLTRSYEDFDVLTPLIEDPNINDIIVRAFDDISAQKGRANFRTGLAFSDPDSYKAFVEQLLKRAGKACTALTPVVDAALGSQVRLCVTHESLSPSGSGPLLTIRLARHSEASLEALSQNGLAPKCILDYLSLLVESGRCSLLLAGEVGTGKTTLVRALAAKIPEDQALLIIEDTEELRLNRPFTRTLLTREANTEGVGRVAPAQAIRAGMRMAMNRIILGEMRDGEAAESFIDVCASGHAGMSTIHARTARDALSRLELFLSRAQGGVGMDTIRRQIANAVSVVIYLGIDKRSHERRILEVIEVGSSNEGLIQISPIFSFDDGSLLPKWERLAGVTRFHELLAAGGVSLPLPGDNLGYETESLYRRYNGQSNKILSANV